MKMTMKIFFNLDIEQPKDFADEIEEIDDDENLIDFASGTFNHEKIQQIEEQDELNPKKMDEDNSATTFVVSSEEPELSDLEQMLMGDANLFADEEDDSGNYSSELMPLGSSQKINQPTSAGNISPPAEDFNDRDDLDASLIDDEEDDFFFATDELDDIPDIDAEELAVSSIFTKDSKTDSSGANKPLQSTANFDKEENIFENDFDSDITSSLIFDSDKINLNMDEDSSVSSPLSDASDTEEWQASPEVETSQGQLAGYFDLGLFNKQLVNGGIVAIVTFIAVFLVSTFPGQPSMTTTDEETNSAETTTEQTTTPETSEPQTQSSGVNPLLALLAGLASGGTTIGLGLLMNNHIKHYIIELQNQFESIYQGNYEVKVTVYSQDEFGTLASRFNQMAKMINATTIEARKRAEETERAREDLQRQVIRLLDDVEGAARGDLTVQAEVTADVLGAVADAFNLTISSLRRIVKQVQQAAIQVNKASGDSEVFARNQSSDALRMAEELAVTLNSVQMMTDSIQRVAENAQEAEEVARSSSVTALKGGDAVELTVAGILQIRETVSETTRKVKRLAEASQQISTIVAVISSISSRTNLLALNASIQAARAGDAGRGFAIVADEVRQLADRSAKSLQEIEQIVLQIQTETGSVMMAMEEGIQQVRDVTERSEQAKRALEDIIQVSNRIDALVRSITADTDEQRENSRGVAKVMQTVELTAQTTSQESQRVAGSLQNLVGIGKDLIASVERFKVD